jgi:hypothetical protein
LAASSAGLTTGAEVVHDELAMMITMTTDGTRLPDEERQCVEQDVLLPAEPIRARTDRQPPHAPPLLFARDQLLYVGKLIGHALRDSLGLRIWALAVQTWYVHLVVAATREPIEGIVRCAGQRVAEGLELKRAIWGDGYLKRLGFDQETVGRWITYVERHNIAIELPPRPWPFVESPDF